MTTAIGYMGVMIQHPLRMITLSREITAMPFDEVQAMIDKHGVGIVSAFLNAVIMKDTHAAQVAAHAMMLAIGEPTLPGTVGFLALVEMRPNDATDKIDVSWLNPMTVTDAKETIEESIAAMRAALRAEA